MKDNLLIRQTITDNIDKIINSNYSNLQQANLFNDDENAKIKLKLTSINSYINILEKERSVNGIILSIDYLKDVNIIQDLLKVKEPKDIPLDRPINFIIGICIGVEKITTKNNKTYYKLSLADSTNVIGVLIYNKITALKFIIGDIYMLKIKSTFSDKNYFSLIKHKHIIDYEFNKIFKNPIIITNLDTVFKNNPELSQEFVMYLYKLINEANASNSIDVIIKRKKYKDKIINIKFGESVYKCLINKFNLKIKY